jgi:hypothetical protein
LRPLIGHVRSITAIVTFLPFLEDWGDGNNDAPAHNEPEEDEADPHEIFLNRGASGYAKAKLSDSDSPSAKAAKKKASTNADEPDEGIVARRLSVTNPYGDDDSFWDKLEDEDEEDYGGNK